MCAAMAAEPGEYLILIAKSILDFEARAIQTNVYIIAISSPFEFSRRRNGPFGAIA